METVAFERNGLILELQEALRTWLSEKPESRSVASLSRSTGVTDSAIRRLFNNGVKISDDSIFSLLSHIFATTSYDAIRSGLNGKTNTQKWFERNFSYLKKAPAIEAYKPSSVTEEIIGNPIAFSVYMQISSVSGLSQSYIKDQFGIRGEVELEKMIQSGLVTIQNGALAAKEQKIKFTKEQAIDLLPELTRMYLKKDSIYNVRALEIEGVSVDGFGDLMDLYTKFLNDVHAIYSAKPGPIPTIVAGFIDTLTPHPYFEGDKNEISN